jgi:hypothetical protein
VFHWLPLELRDEIVAERLCGPAGKKQFNAELTGQPMVVPLSIALLIGDLRRLARAIARRSKVDELGFEFSTMFSSVCC